MKEFSIVDISNDELVKEFFLTKNSFVRKLGIGC
jgi:hypothetical protein